MTAGAVPRPAAPPWLRSLVFVLLFAGAVVVGRESRPGGAEVALVWPAAGVGVWWLMDLRGRRLVVDAALLVVLTVVLQLLTGLPTAAAVLFGVANLGHGLAGRAALRRTWPGGARLAGPADVLRLLVVSAAATAVSSPVSTLLAWRLLDAPPLDSALLFTVRNAGTTFVVLALVVAVRAPHQLADLLQRRHRVEAVAGTALAVLVGVVVVDPDRGLPVGVLAILVPVWAGVRLGVPRAAAVSGLVGALAVVSTVDGSTALRDVSPLQMTAFVQLFTVLAVSIGLLLATLQRQRDVVTEQLRAREDLMRRANESALVGTALVALTDPDRVLTGTNPALRDLFPGAGEPLSWRALLAEESLVEVETLLGEMLAGRARTWNGEVRHLLPSGSTLWTQVHVSALARADGDPVTAVVQMLDTTARRDVEAHLAHLALHDPLTGLPNRLLLRDRLDHDLAAAARGRTRVAVVFLDLDGFKAINDTLGHDVGDAVLTTTAERLQAALRPGDTVGRMGGDEFVACCSDVGTGEQAEEMARRLLGAVTPPMVVGEHLLGVSVSAGVALSRPGEGSASLLRAADAAMYAAKRGGGGRVVASGQDPPSPVTVAG